MVFPKESINVASGSISGGAVLLHQIYVTTRDHAKKLRTTREQKECPPALFSPLTGCKGNRIIGLWRKRVRVELTTRLAESRIAGFEGREGHRTPFASAKSIGADGKLLKAM
jgi:hypothetical protein